MQSKKMDTQPIIALFSQRKSWLNSKGECGHLVQYNPLLNDKFTQWPQVWLDLNTHNEVVFGYVNLYEVM